MLSLSAMQLDCNYLSPEFVKDYIFRLSYIGGLFWVLIFLPIFYWLQCRTKKLFKKLYPNEEIVYVVTSGILSTAIITYIFGASVCAYVLPFLIFKNLQVVGHVTVHNLWYYSLVAIASIWVLLFCFSMMHILSNKRIRTFIRFYKVSKVDKLRHDILYKDIESLKFMYFYLCYQALLINFKDKRPAYEILCMSRLKQAQKIILHYINKERG